MQAAATNAAYNVGVRLRKLESDNAALYNKFYQVGPQRVAGGYWFEWALIDRPPLLDEVVCAVGDAFVSVLVCNLAARDPRMRGHTSLPKEVILGLAEQAIAPVLNVLERQLGASIACIDYVAGVAPDKARACGLPVGFRLLGGQFDPVLDGWVKMPSQFWSGPAAQQTLRDEVRAQRHELIPLAVHVNIGEAQYLPLRQIKALRSGDALRLGVRLGQRDCLPARLVVPGWHHAVNARIEKANGLDCALHVEEVVSNNLTPQTSARATNQDMTDSLDDVECLVSCELGVLRMSVAEVAKLSAGVALKLGAKIDEHKVTILVNGQAVAGGELAMLGDELAVVVTEMKRFLPGA